MPCRFEIFTEFNLVRITCEGRLTHAELLDLVDELDNHPGFHPSIDDLVDMRGVTEFDIDENVSSNLLDLMVGLTLRSNRAKRIAIIAPVQIHKDSAERFRDAMRRVPGMQIGIFPDQASAIEFLGHASHGAPELDALDADAPR